MMILHKYTLSGSILWACFSILRTGVLEKIGFVLRLLSMIGESMLRVEALVHCRLLRKRSFEAIGTTMSEFLLRQEGKFCDLVVRGRMVEYSVMQTILYVLLTGYFTLYIPFLRICVRVFCFLSIYTFVQTLEGVRGLTKNERLGVKHEADRATNTFDS